MNDIIITGDNLPSNIGDIIQRGKGHQRQTVEHILAFASCVAELRRACNTVSGGSEFSSLAGQHWGLSTQMASVWLRVGMKAGALGLSNALESLPPSIGTLYELCQLEPEQLQTIAVTPSLTRQDVIDYRRSLYSPQPIDFSSIGTPKPPKQRFIDSASPEDELRDDGKGNPAPDTPGIDKPPHLSAKSRIKKPPCPAPDYQKMMWFLGDLADLLIKDATALPKIIKALKHHWHPDKPTGKAGLFTRLDEIWRDLDKGGV